jgi:hypothetical protein
MKIKSHPNDKKAQTERLKPVSIHRGQTRYGRNQKRHFVRQSAAIRVAVKSPERGAYHHANKGGA